MRGLFFCLGLGTYWYFLCIFRGCVKGNYVLILRLSPYLNFIFLPVHCHFRGFRKNCKSDCKLCHLRPSLLIEQLGLHWKEIYKICYLKNFGKICQENKSFIKGRQEKGVFIHGNLCTLGRVAQSVQRLTTGWTVRGSNLCGARFSAVPTGPGAPTASCTRGTGSFQGVESGRGVRLTPHPF